jgi:hypothetical protein
MAAEKIIFRNEIEGVNELMPMIEAKHLKHMWVDRCRADLTKARQNPQFGMSLFTHTARCPGIFSLQRTGWVLRTWQDITIETNGDGQSFQWRSAIDQTTISRNKIEAVGSHSKETLAGYMENWSPNSLQTIIKINSGWACKVPKGYSLMEMPIPYLDDSRFTTLHGFFPYEYGEAPMNPLLVWHKLNGKVLIKAGTPIAQYMLVANADFEIETTGADIDSFDLRTTSIQSRFVANYHELKKFFK